MRGDRGVNIGATTFVNIYAMCARVGGRAYIGEKRSEGTRDSKKKYRTNNILDYMCIRAHTQRV